MRSNVVPEIQLCVANQQLRTLISHDWSREEWLEGDPNSATNSDD